MRHKLLNSLFSKGENYRLPLLGEGYQRIYVCVFEITSEIYPSRVDREGY